MDVNLYSLNLVVALCFILAASGTFVISKIYEDFSRHKNSFKVRNGRTNKHFKKILGTVLTVIVILDLGSVKIIQSFFPSDKLPNLMWLMILPFTVSLGLVVLSWANSISWLKFLAIATSCVSLIFSLVFINNFFRFYPTLYSLFSSDTQRLLAEQNQTTIQYGPIQQSEKSTLESQIYSKDPTTNGSVTSLVIPGTVSGFKPRTEWVYIPHIASSPDNPKLPVIVLLPGFPGLTYNWLGGGLRITLDEFAKLHHGITPMVFVVDDTGSLTNDTECVDSNRGQVETYLTVDVPNYIKSHYRVDTDAQNWAIGGLSMGGTCSVMLALRHPDVYKTFLDFSGEIAPEVGSRTTTINSLFGGSYKNWEQHQPLFLLQHHKNLYKGMGAFLSIGRNDAPYLIKSMRLLYKQTQVAGLNSIYEEVSGQHTWHVWEQGFNDALPWASNRLGATDCFNKCIQ